MASTSTSSIEKSFKYDVFLSFRGEDTRKGFIDHLYHALQQKNIHTYKDDERIEKGKRISDELIRSIEDSKFYIIVFSRNYASSSWCLDELVKIMECQKMIEHSAYPVFYDVEPTEVRTQIGPVGEAFGKHENHEAAGKWRDALKDVAELAGWELKNTFNGHEAMLIKKIVQEISLELRCINSSIDEKLVGMETRVKDVVSSLETCDEDVCMLGIKGMGGAGKTTLARTVFDQISIWFEGSSFVENVREVSKGSSGLKKLQKQVLSDALNDKKITVSGLYDGKNKMKKLMNGKRVLVVLDDVDHIDQLDAIAGERSWFKPGSKIIITTRDEQVLVAHGVNLIRDVTLLSNEEAICLFNKYAFRKGIPTQGYEKLLREVLHYVAGLPLTIRVLGSFLCGKDELEWEDALKRLKTIPLKETLEILELSYIGLEEDYKEIFLDVACILKGQSKELAIRALESCGFNARNGLRVLEQKSLITIDVYGYLDMHDRIEEMGQNIVRRLHPNEPYRHSRLWKREEIEDILVKDLGTEATKCIKVSYTKLDSTTILEGLRNMKKLRLLYIDDYDDPRTEESCEFSQSKPNGLQYLCWNAYPFTSLPKDFLNNLVGIEMSFSSLVQFREGGERKVLNKLRIIELNECKLRTLNLGLTSVLETLNLENCYDLVELHMPVEMPKLKVLKISHSKLRTLDIRLVCNLETFIIKKCEDLVELHMPVRSPKLRVLEIFYSKLRILDFGLTLNLETLRIINYDDLVELHMPVQILKLKVLEISHSKLRTLDLGSALNLETLSIINCDGLVELHMPDKILKLKVLKISLSKLRTLDLGPARNLEKLSIISCDDLVKFHMPVGSPKLKVLNISHFKLRTLDLGLTPNLETLVIENCDNLVELHAPLGCLENLVNFNLSGCLRFKSFLVSVMVPLDCSVSELCLVAESLETCPLHSNSFLPKFKFKCFYKGNPPSLGGNVEKLISFGLCACTDLERFSGSICSLQQLRKLTLIGSIPEAPKDLGQLQCLDELVLSCTKIKYLPDSICMLPYLTCLKLESCWHLEKLPEDLGRLESLQHLYLMECIVLRDLPNSVCEMKRLKYFHLPYCFLVDKLPEEVGRLECLKELNIEGAGITHLPQSIFGLKGLHILGSRWRLESYGFTSVIPYPWHSPSPWHSPCTTFSSRVP